MTPKRQRAVERLCEATRSYAQDERQRFLAESCGDDGELRIAVESRLAAEELPWAPPVPGTIVGKYRISRPLGSGGMGVVFAATDEILGRTVALKFIRDAALSSVSRERFLREAVASSSLDHPNIGAVFGVEEYRGQPFILMAWHPGGSLRDRMARGPMPVAEALRIATEIAAGLSAAHARGIVHRDIKPSNILFSDRGTARIVDFGLARMQGSADLTMPGATLGTAAYMAPEQALGKVAGVEADLWALAVVLFEMLSGRPPFQGNSFPAILRAVVDEKPALAGFGEPIARILSRGLRKDPGQRYHSAAELQRDLETAHAALPPEMPTVTLSAAGQPSSRRNFRGLRTLSIAALACVAAGGLGGFGWYRYRNMPPRQIAILPLNAPGDESLRQLADGLTALTTDMMAASIRNDRSIRISPAAELQSARVNDVETAHRKLGAAVVLTGTLTRRGADLVADLNVIQAGKGSITASGSVSAPAGNAPLLQANLAKEEARLLGVKLVAPGDSVHRLETTNPAAWQSFLLATGLLKRSWDMKSLDAAIDLLRPAAASAPESPPLLAALCEGLTAKFDLTKTANQLEAAEGPCRRAPEIDTGYAPGYIRRGVLRIDRGDQAGAIADFQRALVIEPASEDARRYLARAFDAAGLKEKAEATLKELIAAHPASWSVWRELGLLYRRQGQYPQAIDALQHVVKLTPDSAAAYSNLGLTLTDAEQLDRAEVALKHAVGLGPSYAIWSNLGNLYLRQERFDEAGTAYQKAIELDPSQQQVWANLAAAYSRTPGKQGQSNDAYGRAADLCRKALEANPNDAVTLSDLASYEAFTGQRVEPLSQIRKALALAPADLSVLYNAVETYEYLGFREDALLWIKKMIDQGFPPRDFDRSVVLENLRKDGRYRALIAHQK